MPNLTTETIGTGDQRWLGSTHGLYNARTVSLKKSAFTANTHYPNGYIPSGMPLGELTAGGFAPYNSGASDGSQTLAGFLLTDTSVTGDANIPAPLFDHGRVKTAHLPVAFTPPAGNGHFVFVTASNS